MNTVDWNIVFTRVIHSRVEEASNVIQELLDQLREQEWQDDQLFGVHLALEEAIMNAIKHGNQNDASKSVQVELKATAADLHIKIKDEGDGFDPQDVPDPTEDENLEIPSGRGIMLMRHFMTKVNYEDSGTAVVLQKNIAS